MLAGFVKTRDGYKAERAAILDEAHKAADKDRDVRLAEAARQVEDLLGKAKAQAEKDARTAEKAWTDRAGHLAVQIAQRLMGGLDGAALRAAFLNRLLRQLNALPPKERDAIAPDGTALDAVSAEKLDPAEQAACSTGCPRRPAHNATAHIQGGTHPHCRAWNCAHHTPWSATPCRQTWNVSCWN